MTTTIAANVDGPVRQEPSRFYLTPPSSWVTHENLAGRLMETAFSSLIRVGDEECRNPTRLGVSISRPSEPLDVEGLTELVVVIDLSGPNATLGARTFTLGRCTTRKLPNGKEIRNDLLTLPDRATPDGNCMVKFLTWVSGPLSNLYLEIR